MLLSGYEYVTVLVQEKRGECTVPYGTVRETHSTSTRMNFIGSLELQGCSRLFKPTGNLFFMVYINTFIGEIGNVQGNNI